MLTFTVIKTIMVGQKVKTELLKYFRKKFRNLRMDIQDSKVVTELKSIVCDVVNTDKLDQELTADQANGMFESFFCSKIYKDIYTMEQREELGRHVAVLQGLDVTAFTDMIKIFTTLLHELLFDNGEQDDIIEAYSKNWGRLLALYSSLLKYSHIESCCTTLYKLIDTRCDDYLDDFLNILVASKITSPAQEKLIHDQINYILQKQSAMLDKSIIDELPVYVKDPETRKKFEEAYRNSRKSIN